VSYESYARMIITETLKRIYSRRYCISLAYIPLDGAEISIDEFRKHV